MARQLILDTLGLGVPNVHKVISRTSSDLAASRRPTALKQPLFVVVLRAMGEGSDWGRVPFDRGWGPPRSGVAGGNVINDEFSKYKEKAKMRESLESQGLSCDFQCISIFVHRAPKMLLG